MPDRQRWTVRANNELAHAYVDFCERNNISIQAGLEAYALFAIEADQAAHKLPIDNWSEHPPEGFPPAVVEYFGSWVARARAIDHERSRRPQA